jgi:pimeloyl-ACP methyl ester carboxylesterase
MEHVLLHNGRRVAYSISGRGSRPPAVLLHGFCEDRSVWDAVWPHLRGRRLIRIDLPGFGGSEAPLTASIGAYADAICTVLNELDIRQVLLLGHSLGGYTALAFAVQYPERLAALGLIHAHPFQDVPDRLKARQRSIELLQQGKKDLYVTQLFSGLFDPAFAARHPEVVETMIRRAKEFSTEGIIGAIEAMMHRDDHTETLRQAACPVLLLMGETDALIPSALLNDFIHLPRLAHIHILPGVAHMAMLEAPERCAELVMEFMDYASS